MSEPRPDAEPDVYTMPPTAYRVGGAGVDSAVSHPQPPKPAPADAGPADDEPRGRRMWDIVLSVVLLVVGAAVAGLASVLALFLAFASDGCGPANCDYDQMNVGIWVAMASPWVLWLGGLIATIVLLVRRRLGFWVPLVGIALGAVGWAIGAWLVGSAIH